MAIKFTGSAAQNIDLQGHAFAVGVEVDKPSNGVTLISDFGAASLVLTDGNWTTGANDVTINGDVTFNITDTITMGSGLWTIAGNFDPYFAGITFTKETSTIKLTGVGKTWYGGATTCYYNNIWIAAGASITLTNAVYVQVATAADDNVLVDGTLNVDVRVLQMYSGCGISVSATGVINSTTGYVNFKWGNRGVKQMDGTWNADILCSQPRGMTFVPAIYGDGGAGDTIEITLSENTDNIIFPAGTTTFNMDFVVINSGAFTGTVNMLTNNASLDIKGDFSATNTGAGSLVWSKGSGSITFSGGADQTCTVEPAVEDIIFDKSANTVTLANDLTTDSLTGTAGSFDAATYNVTTIGSAIFDFTTLSMGSATWTIGTSFDNADCSTVNRDTAALKLIGTGTFFTGSKYVFSLWIASTATITIPASYGRCGAQTGSPTCLIDGTLICTGYLLCLGNCQTTVSATANISGATGFYIHYPANGGGIVSYSASATVTCTHLYYYYPVATAVLVPADYSSITEFYVRNENASACEMRYSGGTYTFHNWYHYETSSGSLVIDNSVNNPNFVCERYLYIQNSNITWTKGSGTITFSGSNAHGFISTFGHQIENTQVAKTGGRAMYVYNDSTIGGTLNIDATRLIMSTYQDSLTVYGDFTFDNASAAMTMGDATTNLTLYGNYDNRVGANVDKGTGTLILKGVGKSYWNNDPVGAAEYFYAVTVDTGASYTVETAGSYMRVDGGDLKIYGTLTLAYRILTYYDTDTYIYSTGVLNGGGYLQIYRPNNGHGLVLLDGTISCGDLLMDLVSGSTTPVLVAGDYSNITGSVQVRNIYSGAEVGTWTPSAGTYVFNNLLFHTYGTGMNAIYIEGDTNNPNYQFYGDLTYTDNSSGNSLWDSGTGTISFLGGTQDSLFQMSGTYEHIISNKTGGYGLTMTTPDSDACGSISLIAGDLTITGGNLWGPTITLAGSGAVAMTNAIIYPQDWDDTAHTGTQNITCSIRPRSPQTWAARAAGSDITELRCFNVYSTFDGGYTLTSGDLNISGRLEIDDGCEMVVDSGTTIQMGSGAKLALESGGTLSGDGYIYFNGSTGGAGVEDIAGTASIAAMFAINPAASAVFTPGTYETGTFTARVDSGTANFAFRAGDYAFGGQLAFRGQGTGGDLTIDCSTYTPVTIAAVDLAIAITGGSTSDVTVDCSGRDVRWDISDDVIDAISGTGEFVWTRGTGHIDLSTGATPGDVDFCDLEIDTLSQGTWPCYYFDGTGEFHMNNATPFAGGSADAEWALGGWIRPATGVPGGSYEVLFATAVGGNTWLSTPSVTILLYNADHAIYPGKVRFGYEGSNGVGINFASVTTLIGQCDRWRHIWLRRYNNNVELYIDGELDATAACGSVLEADPNDNATLGNYADYLPDGYKFVGHMKDWGKWDSAVLPGPLAQGASPKHYHKSSMRWLLPLDSDTEWFENRTTINEGCIFVEDANDIVLSGGVQPANFYGRHGDLDMNGQTIDSPGNVSLVNTNAQALDEMDDCTINCDTFYQGGSSPDMWCAAQSPWYLNTFTSGDFYTAGVGFCDASRYKFLGDTGPGFGGPDSWSGTGWIMYTEEDAGTRFAYASYPTSWSEHTVAVHYSGGQWYVWNNETAIAFEARATDILIGDVNYTSDTVTDLQGVAATVVNGVVRGYDHGDLTMIPDWYNGVADNGEFTVEGTYFKAWGSNPVARPICDDRTGNIGVNFDKSQIIMLNSGAASYDAGIYVCNTDGSEYRLLNYTQEDSVEQISTQQSGEMIYWTSSVTHGWMSRMSRDGLFYERIKTGLGRPFAMAVCAEHGYVWWSEYDAGTLQRCNLDGSNQVSMGSSSQCSGLAVDPIAKKLYVSEKGVDIIYSMNFDGTSKTAVHTLASTNNPRRLTIDYINGWLFWTEDDTGGSRIRRGTTAGGSLGVVWSASSYATGLEYNHNDEYLYFANGDGYVWKIKPLTGTDLQIVVDKSDSSENYLGVGTWDGDPVGGAPGNCPDDTDGKLYVADVGTSKSIRRIDLDFTADTKLMEGRVTAVSSLKCDDVNGKIYWVDWADRCIKRSNLNGSRPEVVIDNRVLGPYIYRMAIDPVAGFLFFTDDGPAMFRSNLDGTDRRTIRTSGAADSNYYALDCERESQRVYWTSRNTGKILYCNYDGSSVTTRLATATPWHMCIDNVNRRVIWTNQSNIYQVMGYDTGAAGQFGTGGSDKNITYSPDNDTMYLAYSGTVYGRVIGPATGGTGITALWSPSGGDIDGVTICHKHLPTRGDGTSKLMIFADGLHNMHNIDTKGENLRILTGQVAAQILNESAYANTSRMLFWADYSLGQIRSGDPEMLTTPVLMHDDASTVRALCISQTREELYFYSHTYGIWKMPFTGGTPVNILPSGYTGTATRGMWCQENEGTKGKIYWCGSDDYIRKADCDGGNSENWLSGLTNVGNYPISITGDNKGHIFWGCYSDGKIKRADEDGSNIVLLRTMGTNGPAAGGMVYNPRDDFIYWGNNVGGNVYRMRSDGTDFEEIYLAAGTVQARSLAIIHGLDIPMKDPVLWLKMDDDAASNVVTDYSANAEHQTVQHETTPNTEDNTVAGVHGAQALDFDVAGHGCIYLTDAATKAYLAENVDFTISWWWKSNDPGAATANHFMSNYNGNNSSIYCMLYNNNVYLYCQKSTNGGVSVTSSFNHWEATDSEWHHYAITRKGLTMVWYIDGVAQVTQTHADNYVDFSPTTTNLQISLLSPSSQSSDGYCQDYRIYDRAMTIEQINAAMNFPRVPVR